VLTKEGKVGGVSTKRLGLLLLIVAAGFVAAPATVLAKPKPRRARYVLVSHTKGCSVTVNPKTGKLRFKANKGHYGKFTVVVKHGKKTTVYHFTVKKPKLSNPVPVPDPRGAPGAPTVPPPAEPVPSPIQPVEPPTPPASAPANVAPVVQRDSGVLSWAAQPGASGYKGAISDGPRGTNRTTQYVGLGLNTSWKPQVVPCGQTLYYGVASEGNAGDQWVANETAISGPACQKSLSPYPVTWSDSVPPAGVFVPEVPMQSCGNAATRLGVDGYPLCAITGSWAGYGCLHSDFMDPCPTVPDMNEASGLCEDFVTVLNYLDSDATPKASYYTKPNTDGADGYDMSCWAVTKSGRFVILFNEYDIPSGVIAVFASVVAGIFPHELPVPTDVGPGIIVG
jgi:hypothetical protein